MSEENRSESNATSVVKVPGIRCKQPELVLEMNLEVILAPEHQVGAFILIVVHFVDTTLSPRIVSISVCSEDPFHLSGWTDLHFFGERAVAHLDEHPKAIKVRYYKVVATIIVHVLSDVYVGDFAAARRLEVGSNCHQRVFRCRLRVKPVQAIPLVGN